MRILTKNQSGEADGDVNPANNDEHLLDPRIRNPIIHEKRERKCQRIFKEVDLTLAGFFTGRIP
jgi:hypothetical protein